MEPDNFDLRRTRLGHRAGRWRRRRGSVGDNILMVRPNREKCRHRDCGDERTEQEFILHNCISVRKRAISNQSPTTRQVLDPFFKERISCVSYHSLT